MNVQKNHKDLREFHQFLRLRTHEKKQEETNCYRSHQLGWKHSVPIMRGITDLYLKIKMIDMCDIRV